MNAGPQRRLLSTMPGAHFLGLDLPKPKAATAKTRAVTATALRKPAATPNPASKPAQTKPTVTATKAATRERCAMPFSTALGIAPSAGSAPTRTTRDQRAGTTEQWPEVVNGVATGRTFEVHRSDAAEPKLDARAIARRIIAAGKRAFSK